LSQAPFNSKGSSKGNSNSCFTNAKHRWDSETANAAERAVILVPDFRNLPTKTAPVSQYSDSEISSAPILKRSLASRIEEAVGLARAIDLNVVASLGVPVRNIQPATLFGKGKVEEIATTIAAHEAGLAIIDGTITPVQQQNLEKAWDCKVLDRTGLILEIFGERARTREGRAQVELAHLNYQKGR
jgi:GTP-binding protein HflX